MLVPSQYSLVVQAHYYNVKQKIQHQQISFPLFVPTAKLPPQTFPRNYGHVVDFVHLANCHKRFNSMLDLNRVLCSSNIARLIHFERVKEKWFQCLCLMLSIFFIVMSVTGQFHSMKSPINMNEFCSKVFDKSFEFMCVPNVGCRKSYRSIY